MTKHVVTVALLGGIAAVLGGCPIYSDNGSHRVCVGDSCYECPTPSYSRSCTEWICRNDTSCPSGYTCESDRRCRLRGTTPTPPAGRTCAKPADCTEGENCGADRQCHPGDCSTTGCPTSYVCKLGTGSKPVCVPNGSGGRTSTCKTDRDCPSPAGSKCLSGACVAPQDLCVDGTQCPEGSQCVQGTCTPSCNSQKPCPIGYSCDEAKGVCTGPGTACDAAGGCTNGRICVLDRCVAPCGDKASCGPGLVCVDGGCIPEQKPNFVCQADGENTGCTKGSVCLRHTCYIGCDADAGADACKSADKFNVCKPVSTVSGSFSVCGSSTNLGTDCDVGQGKNCTAGAVCIDGFCR